MLQNSILIPKNWKAKKFIKHIDYGDHMTHHQKFIKKNFTIQQMQYLTGRYGEMQIVEVTDINTNCYYMIQHFHEPLIFQVAKTISIHL